MYFSVWEDIKPTLLTSGLSIRFKKLRRERSKLISRKAGGSIEISRVKKSASDTFLKRFPYR